MYSEPPASELTKAKMWRKFQWWWCGNKTGGQCEEYRRHKPQNCRGLARSVQERKQTPDIAPSQPSAFKPTLKRKVQLEAKDKKDSKQIKLSKALAKAAVMEQNDDDIVGTG